MRQRRLVDTPGVVRDVFGPADDYWRQPDWETAKGEHTSQAPARPEVCVPGDYACRNSPLIENIAPEGDLNR